MTPVEAAGRALATNNDVAAGDQPERQVFAFRDSVEGALQLVLAPGEEVKPGDVIVLDYLTGRIRKVREGDEQQSYVVPAGSYVNGNGFLEMPVNHQRAASDPQKDTPNDRR